MNIQTVASNLRTTIAGKELVLQEYKNDAAEGLLVSAIGYAAIKFLEVNIDELQRILQDVEVCAKQASDDSWITNPDRQGGGGWTADELDANRGWR